MVSEINGHFAHFRTVSIQELVAVRSQLAESKCKLSDLLELSCQQDATCRRLDATQRELQMKLDLATTVMRSSVGEGVAGSHGKILVWYCIYTLYVYYFCLHVPVYAIDVHV